MYRMKPEMALRDAESFSVGQDIGKCVLEYPLALHSSSAPKDNSVKPCHGAQT